MKSTRKAHDSLVRGRAFRRGYRVEKSRQALHADNQGDYQLIDLARNAVVLGDKYDATLEEIEEVLAEKEPQRVPRRRRR